MDSLTTFAKLVQAESRLAVYAEFVDWVAQLDQQDDSGLPVPTLDKVAAIARSVQARADQEAIS